MGKEAIINETDRSVFISGIPYTSSEEEVKTIFTDCGPIELILSLSLDPSNFQSFKIAADCLAMGI